MSGGRVWPIFRNLWCAYLTTSCNEKMASVSEVTVPCPPSPPSPPPHPPPPPHPHPHPHPTPASLAETVLVHYSDVIKGTMASQITNLTIVYSTVQIKENTKAPCHWPLCAQRASNAENVFI